MRNHYDAIIDTGGNRRLSDLRRALTRRGKPVIVGGETDGRWLGGADRLLRAPLLSLFVSQKLAPLSTSENTQDLISLGELLATGKISPAIDRTYPLSEVPAAVRYVQEGNAPARSLSPCEAQPCGRAHQRPRGIGSIKQPRARAPAKPDKPKCRTQIVKMKRPITIDGTPVMTLLMKRK